MSFLILWAFMAHAELETNITAPAKAANTKTQSAQNSVIECMARSSELVGKREDPWSIPDGVLERYMSICRKSSPLAQNLINQLKKAGYTNPTKEAAQIKSTAELKSRLPGVSQDKAEAIVNALNDLRKLHDDAPHSQTATLETEKATDASH